METVLIAMFEGRNYGQFCILVFRFVPCKIRMKRPSAYNKVFFDFKTEIQNVFDAPDHTREHITLRQRIFVYHASMVHVKLAWYMLS